MYCIGYEVGLMNGPPVCGVAQAALRVNNPHLVSGRDGKRIVDNQRSLWAGVLLEVVRRTTSYLYILQYGCAVIQINFFFQEQPSDYDHFSDGHPLGGGIIGGRDPLC